MNRLRRKLCLGLAGAALPWCAPVLAAGERAKRIYIITFRGRTQVEQGFRAYLASQGRPLEYIERDLNRDSSRFPALVEEIRRLRPDLVLTWGTTVTEGIVGRYDAVDPRVHITDIPVLFTLVAAPVSAGLVPSLSASGRNLTGVYHVASTESQVRAMGAYRRFRRVGVLYTPTENNSLAILRELQQIGASQGFQVEARPFRLDGAGRPVIDGVARLLGEMKAAGAEWLYLSPDSFLGAHCKEVVIPLAHGLGLPTFASTEQIMEAGALAGLISRYHSIGQFTGYKAAQILFAGQDPSRMPIETLSRYSFLIRMAVARALHLVPPLAMFDSAEFIE